jgi:uncharacterized membrane protein YhaH (DUF805 family)
MRASLSRRLTVFAMLMFRPLMRYADFKGRASRAEYWLFGVLQGLWYCLLMGLAVMAMGQGADFGDTSRRVLVLVGIMVLSLFALVVPNYAVLVRRLHDSGRGAIWLCLLLPTVLSSVLMVGTIATAVGSVGLGASREAFVGTALAGLGAAGVLSIIGYVGQLVMFILALLPGTRGDNKFGPDPRDPSQRYGGGSNPALDADRWDALIAEAKRGDPDVPYKPVFDFGPGPIQPEPVRREEAAPFPAQPQWSNPAWDPGVAPSRPFGRRGA